jgi:Kdo2-lipid IVA lauroyltransferase/acyltransferase
MKPLKKPIKYRVQYFLVVLAMKVIQAIPRSCGIAGFRVLANMFHVAAPKHQINMIHHLTLAFGNEKTAYEIQKLARDVPRHFAVAGVDTLRIPNMIREGLDRYVKSENMHILDEAMRAGKGAILLTGHFGNWELMGAYVAQKQYPIRVVGSPLKNPLLDKLLVDMRNNAGYRNIPRGKSAKEILRALKKSALLGVLIDQDIKNINGVFVDFFGRKAHTPIGPVVLAVKFGIPIIPVFIHLEKDLTYHIQCFDPIELTLTGDTDMDIIINTQKCSDVYETVIRQHPEQWAWIHRRWKKKADEIQSEEDSILE